MDSEEARFLTKIVVEVFKKKESCLEGLMIGIEVIGLAGSVCGVLDLISATALFKLNGGRFERLLQFVASGALGESAFNGGKKSAVAGLLIHFSIAFTAAAVYYATSRSLAFLLKHALIGGILYDVAIHLFMNFAVIPLSRIPNANSRLALSSANLLSTRL